MALQAFDDKIYRIVFSQKSNRLNIEWFCHEESIWKCLDSILRIQSHGIHNDAVIKTTQTSQEFPIKLIIET